VITGVHSIIYSTNPEADRAFLRDVLNLSKVDVGEGWLIFRIASGGNGSASIEREQRA
jgi:hypothetical protein